MLLLMSSLDPRRLLAIALFAFLAGPSFGQQDSPQTFDSSDDRALSDLVDEVWNDAGDKAGPSLELSLAAARAIGVANDLSLQGAVEFTEASRYRELGSWGAFDWNFSAGARLEDSTLDPSTEFEVNNGVGDIDTNNRSLTVGFDRAFRSGDSFSVSLAHNNRSTNSLFARNGNSDVLSAAYVKPLLRGAGEDYATSLQEIAGLRFEADLEALGVQRQRLLLDVEMKYWDLVLSNRQLEVAGSALDLAIEQLERDRRRREAGVATDVEVIQDEATVARRIEGLLLVQTAVRSRMDSLRSTLFPGIGDGSWSVQIFPITPMTEIVPAPAMSDWQMEIQSALEARREVRSAEIEVEIAELLNSRAVSQKASSLDLLFELGSQGFDSGFGSSLGEAFGFDSPTMAAGLTYQLPMKNTALENEERAIRAELRAAILALDALKSQIAQEVREALRQVRYQAEASRAATKTREAAERLMTAEKTRYEQGLATNFQVLEFQQALLEAQYGERAVRIAYCQAQAALEAARGSLGRSPQASAGASTP